MGKWRTIGLNNKCTNGAPHNGPLIQETSSATETFHSAERAEIVSRLHSVFLRKDGLVFFDGWTRYLEAILYNSKKLVILRTVLHQDVFTFIDRLYSFHCCFGLFCSHHCVHVSSTREVQTHPGTCSGQLLPRQCSTYYAKTRGKREAGFRRDSLRMVPPIWLTVCDLGIASAGCFCVGP